jgi:hypothetical protein
MEDVEGLAPVEDDDIVVDVVELEDDADPIEALRHMPVGTNDPNIVGDVGPLDVPPGSDPHLPEEFVPEETVDEAPAAS